MMTQTHEEMWRTIAAIETAAIPPWELFRLDFDAWVLDGMRDHAIGPMTRMLAEIGMRPRSAAELNGVNLRYLFRRLYQMPRGYAWGVRRADDHAKCSSVDTENGTVTYYDGDPMTELGRIQLNRRRWGDVCIVRPMDPTEGTRERALVLNSWVRSWIPFSRPLVGAHHAGEIVEGYLRDCDQVLVATPGEGSTVCGWVARLEPGVLAYVYVLHNFRRQGIGERLMREAGIDPRGARWQFLFSTPRLRRLCRVDLRHPERMPWNGAPNAKGKDGSGNGHGNRRGLRTR